MISRSWSRKSIAVTLAVAVLSVYSMAVLAAPGAQRSSGELSVSGQVSLNGQSAISGATIFSDSTVTTGANSSAVVSLGKLGRVEVLANSSVKIAFTDGSFSTQLDAGRVRVNSAAGTTATVTTKDGVVVADSTQTDLFTVDVECGNTTVATQTGIAALRGSGIDTQVAAGSSASAGQAAPGSRCTKIETAPAFGSLSGGALAALLLAAGGAIVAVVIAGGDNNDLNSDGGNTTVVSPTK
ncbi:MAG: hypothetical protein ABIP75_16010 [Pyrinomonadaceae bacterium]